MDLSQNDSSVWHCSACYRNDVNETLMECNSKILECECGKMQLIIPGNSCDTRESDVRSARGDS